VSALQVQKASHFQYLELFIPYFQSLESVSCELINLAPLQQNPEPVIHDCRFFMGYGKSENPAPQRIAQTLSVPTHDHKYFSKSSCTSTMLAHQANDSSQERRSASGNAGNSSRFECLLRCSLDQVFNRNSNSDHLACLVSQCHCLHANKLLDPGLGIQSDMARGWGRCFYAESQHEFHLVPTSV